ncbi:MAG: heme exporter protein CcmD [Hyphomicrobiaceae bacterium]
MRVDLGPNAVFVLAAYAAFAVVITALLLWLISDGRRQQRRLDDLEARGVTRRSAGATGTADERNRSRGATP